MQWKKKKAVPPMKWGFTAHLKLLELNQGKQNLNKFA